MSREDKPLVTFALFAYNQERFIREAVEGALAQNYDPLEIIISDDCSSDNTLNVIRDVISEYAGPHKVILNSNKTNLGLIEHVNKIASLSSGNLIVVAAGDDISYSFRTTVLADIFYSSEENPLLIHSPVEKISQEGKPLGMKYPPIKLNKQSDQIRKAPVMDAVYIGASGAWNKRLFEIFGPIAHPEAYEDIVLGARAAMMGELVYCPSPLLKYRMGAGMTTNPERFKSCRSFFSWRRKWIAAMESAYLQRVEDSTKIDSKSGKRRMKKRLESFSIKKRMYSGKKALVIEFSSNPAQCVRLIFSEMRSITSIWLYQAWSLMRSI